MLLLPGLLAWAVMAWDTHVRRRRRPDLPPAQPWPILAAAITGVLSHPFLDWLNNYGVRLLMPFEDRWFYGDALFIVDPWLWLYLAAGVMFTWTRTRVRLGGALALVILAAGLLVTTDVVAPAAKAAWVAGLVGLLGTRLVLPARFADRAARVGVALAAVYIATMVTGSRIAEHRVRALAGASGWDVSTVAAMPVPAQPFRRQVIAVTAREYLFVDVTWPLPLPAAPGVSRASRGTYSPVIAAALDAPGIQGVRHWLRFPSYEVLPRPGGAYRVYIRDARFAVGNRPGFGIVATVDLDAQLRPVAP
jgi:inner membrane protein